MFIFILQTVLHVDCVGVLEYDVQSTHAAQSVRLSCLTGTHRGDSTIGLTSLPTVQRSLVRGPYITVEYEDTYCMMQAPLC